MGGLEQYLAPSAVTLLTCMDCCFPISKCPWLREGKPVPGLDGQETDVCCRQMPGRRKALGDYIRHRALPAGTKVKGRRKSSGGK